jgi:DnaJ-class molecular chaperone
MKCKKCKGDGWTAEHDPGPYSHDEEGNCLGYCPVQVQCQECNGTGETQETK